MGEEKRGKEEKGFGGSYTISATLMVESSRASTYNSAAQEKELAPGLAC